jgi:hypothetical protein
MYPSIAVASLMALATAASAMPTAQPLKVDGISVNIPPAPKIPPFSDHFNTNTSSAPGGTPNVALFDLGASVTPPSGVTLKTVFFGTGTNNPTIR